MNKQDPKYRAIELAKHIAKKRDNFICVRCSKSRFQGVIIDGSHIFSVTYGNIAADPENILTLCRPCHSWATDSWHNKPKEAKDWLEYMYPGLYEKLRIKSFPIVSIKKYQWEEKLLELKKRV